MTYAYTPDDMFYDVESLSNVFTVAWWIPASNAIILSYIDDDNIIQTASDLDYIKDHIYNIYPKLKASGTQIVFENIKYTGCINEYVGSGPNTHAVLGMQSFAKRLGLANQRTYLNTPVNKRRMRGGGTQYDVHYYPVKDTDPDYDPQKHGFRFGYNSTNYDLTMLAQLLGQIRDDAFKAESTNKIVPWPHDEKYITARNLRKFNDELFSDEWRGSMPMRLAQEGRTAYDNFGNFQAAGWILRKSWLLTGRYIDVARLNEKLQKVGLKRLLGMLGLQIMESDKLSNNTVINNLEEMADLLAYNISDVINLQSLFDHKIYQNTFNVRGDLLKTFPSTVYGQKKHKEFPGDTREPQVDTGNYTNIRRDRLTRESTSAKFVELAIAPYAPIKDIPAVSFKYPSEQEAKKLGIEQTDILEDTKRFFEENVTNDPESDAHKDFMAIYNFYDKIRGRNFNSSDAYAKEYNIDPDDAFGRPYIKSLMTEYNTNLFYYHIGPDGRPYPSTSLANFSVGGIHGAEVNMEKYKADVEKYNVERTMQSYVESQYTDATEAVNGPVYIELPAHLEIPERLKNKVREDRTVKIRDFVKSGSTKKRAIWRDVTPVEMFKKPAGGTYKVADRYAYVSVGPSHHEDFTSYYPLLLSRLSVFINPDYHGYDENGAPADPYYEMFLTRVAKKKESKDMTLPQEQRDDANREQESRKLLINAASGVGDAPFDNNIRANNAVMSMRIIGQLFAWRIGQAQALAGARVPSTNTDGLYTMGISAAVNDEILERIAADMHIGIEPERLERLVSKDSNNRLEVAGGKIVAASGGTLTSWQGPEPVQSLDHAAIIDHALVQYLADTRNENPADKPFDRGFTEDIINKFIRRHIRGGTPQQALRFFQWIISASTGTHRYNYAKHINTHTGESRIENLQHFNRIFLVKGDGQSVRTEIYLATRRAIDKKKWEKRMTAYKNGEITKNELREHHPEALQILSANGLDLADHADVSYSAHYRDEASMQKVRSMPANQHVVIYNQSVLDLTNDEAINILKQLDLEAYIGIVEATFKSWSNL